MIPRCVVVLICLLSLPATAFGQLAPEIGYVHPAGIQAGTSVEVTLGGYDWTPDMQLFCHDPRVKVELLSPPSPVLITEAPYWFGAKARGYAWPLPREFRARLTVAADVSPGLVRWQVANANGVSPVGVIHVGLVPDLRETATHGTPQILPQLPIAVSGQIRRIEEVDRYQFVAQRPGPVTIELIARQLAATGNQMTLHGMLQVDDETGRRVLDESASEGNDLIATFATEANRTYTISLHDLDFAGDRSYVYRLLVTPSPGLITASPAAGKRGETRPVEFVGWGLTTGTSTLESVTREISFPADPVLESFAVSVETPFGTTRPYAFPLSDSAELVEGSSITQLPAAITGTLETRFGTDEYSVTFKQGETWQIAARSRKGGMPLDLDLRLLAPDGKELAAVDDMPGSTDPEVTFTAPADGTYRVVISDRSGHSGDRGACYRLSIHAPIADFTVTFPDQISVPLGGTAKIPVAVVRRGAFKGPIQLTIDGLPEGMTVPASLVLAEDKNNLDVEVSCAANAPASASLVHIAAAANMNGVAVTRPVKTLVAAAIMKPRIKITPEGLDDVSKVRRGSTHLFPLLIDRLEGFDGEITLEMTAKQQRHRQGLASDEYVVPVGAKKIDYPIFVPEWMETTKTSRMILNGAAQVQDPTGKLRTLLQRMELRLGILPEGALMKLSQPKEEFHVMSGGDLTIPVSVSCTPDFNETIHIELVPDDAQAGIVVADPITLPPGQTRGTLTVRFSSEPRGIGVQTLQLRATAHQNGKWLVKSETTANVQVRNP